MLAFDIGWIPGNWKRGDKIKISRINGPTICAMLTNEKDDELILDQTSDHKNSILVTVYTDQIDKANAWLRWFCNPELDPK